MPTNGLVLVKWLCVEICEYFLPYSNFLSFAYSLYFPLFLATITKGKYRNWWQFVTLRHVYNCCGAQLLMLVFTGISTWNLYFILKIIDILLALVALKFYFLTNIVWCGIECRGHMLVWTLKSRLLATVWGFCMVAFVSPGQKGIQ